MDKFLDLCFSVGKVLLSILLVISLIISLLMLFRTLGDTIKLNNIEITYSYDVKKIIENEIYPNKQILGEIESPKNELKAGKIIKDFAKEQNLSENKTNDLLKVVALIDEKEQINYFKHFVKFFNVYKNEAAEFAAKEKNIERNKVEDFIKTNINDIVSVEYNKFYELYNKEKESKLIEKKEQENQRNLKFITFLISLGVFISCLFLPLLIRIEKNTRNESR